ncbi:transposase [Flavivirga spongiicola]|uniref:transposase n=1 Tax=Flavivirga spongiicola TaxID=421621 RepID=UPI0038CBF426
MPLLYLTMQLFTKEMTLYKLLKRKGHTLEFLPPYSPDLNPIDKKWAQAKSIRRKLDYTPDELFLYAGL